MDLEHSRWMAGGTLAALLVLSSCDEPDNREAYWQSKEEITTLSQQLELLKYRQQQCNPETATALAWNTDQLKNLFRISENLIKERTALISEIEKMEENLAKAEHQAILHKRSTAKGLKLDRFTAMNGRVFEDVTITSVDDIGVSIRHSQGAATLRYGDLSPADRERFGLDLISAQIAEKREMEADLAYDQWIEKGMKLIEKKNQSDARLASIEEEKSAQLRSAMLAKNEANYRNRPLAQPATQVGSGSIWSRRWYGDWYYGYRRPSVYYYTPSYQPRISCFGASTWNSYPQTATPRVVQQIQFPSSPTNPPSGFPNPLTPP